jgi:hypothetical protein
LKRRESSDSSCQTGCLVYFNAKLPQLALVPICSGSYNPGRFSRIVRAVFFRAVRNESVGHYMIGQGRPTQAHQVRSRPTGKFRVLFVALFLTALAVRAYSDEPKLFAPFSSEPANTNSPETAERTPPDRPAVERAAWTADEDKTPTLAPTPATPLSLTQPGTIALPSGTTTVTTTNSTEPTLQVRVAWGGGTERIWQGRISLISGTIADPRLLGVEADESGTIWP